MPTKPGEPPGEWIQRRISTGLNDPARASEAVELAEKLGRALERDRTGLEPFDWTTWERMGGRQRRSSLQASGSVGVSGAAALSATRRLWHSKGSRGRSAEESWDVDYRQPLAALVKIADLQPSHLLALVDACRPSSRSRLRAGRAAALTAHALGWDDDLVSELRERGKGYSARNAAPRDLPTDRAIEAFIDRLPDQWQWPVGLVATNGCRPHEALLHAEVLSSGLLKISEGKTGARQSLAMPGEWLQRWKLSQKRLPSRMQEDRGHRAVGMAMGRLFRRANAGFVPYDLRHSWAVRAIHTPQISPSRAAKSMGHSL